MRSLQPLMFFPCPRPPALLFIKYIWRKNLSKEKHNPVQTLPLFHASSPSYLTMCSGAVPCLSKMTSVDSSYAPLIPSPLNPISYGPDGCSTRASRRRRGQSVRRRPTSHTLAQRLMRSKAAEAWRGHVLSSQLAQGDNIGVVRRKAPRNRVSSASLSYAGGYRQ